MESPIVYALNCIVSDAPWLFMGCVAFWEHRRVKKEIIILESLVLLALRIAGAYLITAYTLDWQFWDVCFVLVFDIVMLAGYIAMFRVHPVKVIYIFLIMFILGSFSNLLAGLMVMPFIPEGRSPYDTVWFAAAIAVLLAVMLPFLYKTFRILLRRAFGQLPNKTILLLCFTPAVFVLSAPFIHLFEAPGSGAPILQGVLSLVAFAACYINVHMLLDAAKHIQTENALALEKRLAREGYERVEAHLREVSGLKHDMNRHLAALQAYLEHGRSEEAQSYLARYAEQAASVTETEYSQHFLMNAVAGNLYQRAGEHGVKAEVKMSGLPAHIADPDLYSLLSNLTDNALEACMAMPEGKERFIRLTVSRHEPYLSVRCENSKSGDIISADGKIQTTKAGEGHGYGLWTVGRVVDAYEGMMNIEHDADTFTVMLALKDRQDSNTP